MKKQKKVNWLELPSCNLESLRAPYSRRYLAIDSRFSALGSSTIKPNRFIKKVVRKLKGLDDRAVKRFENKLKVVP